MPALPRRRSPGVLGLRARGPLAACLLVLAGAILCLSGPRPGRAQSQAEYEIKAAFMYNFAKFVQWPASAFEQPQSPLTLCVIGRDDFGHALDTIDHKMAQGHELQVRRQIRLDDARSCHILFVSESERPRLSSILKAVAAGNVLTIGDTDGFAESGGIIGLYNLDDKVQFSINLEQAQRASLQINSQLLKLAKIVRRAAREDDQ